MNHSFLPFTNAYRKFYHVLIFLQGMMERLNNMHQEIENAAQRCENLGSTDNLDESDLPQNTPIHKLATQVTADLQHATGEVRIVMLLSYFKIKEC